MEVTSSAGDGSAIVPSNVKPQQSLNVIALISGGKDSFFSILHCLQNGHKIVALGNLHPIDAGGEELKERGSEEEADLNSFMYQTVGHTVIPLYAKALGIPVYRQPILGSAIQTGTTYEHTPSDLDDETESLLPLLKRIMQNHPEANAVSTGAILSTYQRTRIESVALRLGLAPLAFLWKYPILPPCEEISLLRDMQAVGLDARIVKVASGGLDEGFLWSNVASGRVWERIEKSMRRFGNGDDGAVLGEGGEFETLVLDGPKDLFKGRIVVEDEGRKIIWEGGGSAFLRIEKAEVVMKDGDVDEADGNEGKVRIPDLLEGWFEGLLNTLMTDVSHPDGQRDWINSRLDASPLWCLELPAPRPLLDGIRYWTFTASARDATGQKLSRLAIDAATISDEATQVVSDIRQRLHESSLEPTNIVSSMIILRSMEDFAVINQARTHLQFSTFPVILPANPPYADLRYPLHPPESPLSGDNRMRYTSRYQYNGSSSGHPRIIPIDPQSPPRAVPLLLGPREHRAVLTGNRNRNKALAPGSN